MLPERVRRRLVGILSAFTALFLAAAPRVNAQECVQFRCELSNPEFPDEFLPEESTVLLTFPAGVPELQPGERQELPESVWRSDSAWPGRDCGGEGCFFRIEREQTGELWVEAESFTLGLRIELETSDGRPGERWQFFAILGGIEGPATVTKGPCAKQVPLSPYPLAVALLLTGTIVLARRKKKVQSSTP